MHKLIATSCFVFLCIPTAQAEPLFSAGSPRMEDVKQADRGTCYVHATLAAIAKTNPQRIKRMLTKVDGQTFKVRFPGNSTETVYLEDAEFARKTGFDKSDGGLWVRVFLRGFAQHVLRQRLNQTVGKMRLAADQKTFIKALFEGERLIILDRLIREVVRQDTDLNNIPWDTYAKRYVNEFVEKQISDPGMKALVTAKALNTISALKGSQIERAVLKTVRDNTMLWGSFRGIGSGGRVTELFQLIEGRAYLASPQKIKDLRAALSAAGSVPMVASTRPSLDARAKSSLEMIEAHAYTVLGMQGDRVLLRNPWGHKPGRDGMLALSLDDFKTYFMELVSSKPIKGR